MKPLKQAISLTLDNNVVQELRILAVESDRSVSSYINIILKEHLLKIKSGQTSDPQNHSEHYNFI